MAVLKDFIYFYFVQHIKASKPKHDINEFGVHINKCLHLNISFTCANYIEIKLVFIYMYRG